MWIKKVDVLGVSDATTLNFLWKAPRQAVYVMDNHLAALWCWLKHLSPDDVYTLFHIDNHWDFSDMGNEDIGKLASSNVEQLKRFLALRECCRDLPMVRWDNYIAPLIHLRPGLHKAISTAHQIEYSASLFGDKRFERWPMQEFFSQLRPNLDSAKGKILVNIDLDYLYLKVAGTTTRAFSEEFIVALGNSLDITLRRGALMTVAWSPGCCKGWNDSASVCKILCKALDISCPVSTSWGKAHFS